MAAGWERGGYPVLVLTGRGWDMVEGVSCPGPGQAAGAGWGSLSWSWLGGYGVLTREERVPCPGPGPGAEHGGLG